MKNNLNQEIEANLAKIAEYSSQKEYIGCILLELETARLIKERDYQEMTSLVINNTKKLEKIDKKLDKLLKEVRDLQETWAINQQQQGFLSKIKSIFK